MRVNLAQVIDDLDEIRVHQRLPAKQLDTIRLHPGQRTFHRPQYFFRTAIPILYRG